VNLGAGMIIRIFIFLFLLNVCGCSFAESESVVIKGTSYTYSISNELIKLNDSILDAKGLSGDMAKSFSLLIPANRFSAEGKNDVAVLLFLDHDYGRPGLFGQFVKNMLKEARRLEASDEFRFVKKSGSRVIEYQSSFDPFAETVVLNKHDYFARVIEPEVIDIPGVRTLSPKTTCKIWFVSDGILFQVVAFEKLCLHRANGSLLKSLNRLLDEWRVSA
jgi:hypothetical protein